MPQMIPKHRDAPAPPAPEPEPDPWWERPLQHPLSDADFSKLFCYHVFATTTDPSLRVIRERVFRFVRNYMAADAARELAKYRLAYGV